jgi:dTDP-4-amino-4,6-dideoxygalactose transaminase
LTNLESLDEFLAVNRRNYQLYESLLRGLPGVQLVPYDQRERCNYQYVVLEIDEDEAGISRDRLIELLTAREIRARRYFFPGCHRMEPYRSLVPQARYWLSETERLLRRIAVLPTGTSVGPTHIARICEIIRSALREAGHACRPDAERPVSSSLV